MQQGAIKQQVMIHTLGKFMICRGEIVLSESSSRSQRMWDVFKYLLSNRDKSFRPEDILAQLWPDKDYIDPGAVLRSQTYRLRQVLDEGGSAGLASNIAVSGGFYSWADNFECWIDADEFTKLATTAKEAALTDPEQAIGHYCSALSLYKGHYLPESTFSEWVIPARARYHNLFLEAVFALTDLYQALNRHQDIIRVLEQAAAIDYFEEKIHLRLIEALLAEGLTTRAKAHYNDVTSVFYREMGIKPSAAMKSVYRLIGLEAGSFELDLGTIQEGLKGKEQVKGAYLCDPELFRYFYKLEQVRGERGGKAVLLCLLTLTKPDYSTATGANLKKTMDHLQQVILNSLRKGDLVTRWNEAQFLLLLPGLNREQAVTVLARIEKSYLAKYNFNGLHLHKKIETILPLEGDSHFF